MYKEYKHLPGWKIEIKEVSNSCFISRAERTSGNIIEYQGDVDFKRIEKSILEIEKQVNDKFNLFIYHFIKESIDPRTGEVEISNDKNDFCSWYIRLENKRFVFDGKDSWMIKQIKEGIKWKDKKIYKDKNIDSDIVLSIREWIKK